MRSLINAFALVAVACPALAQTSERGNDDLRKYCSGDAVAFCSGKDPDRSEMDACFKSNMGKLSENCRRAIQAYKGK